MALTLTVSFLAGLMSGNAFPHFVKGIVRERYPTVMGDSPVINLIAGWVGLVLACFFEYLARPTLHPEWAFATPLLVYS